jgi:hypothetical protein
MGALRTCCGYYCASVALVGVYFFLMMAIMEFRGNTYIVQILQRIPCDEANYNITTKLCCSDDWAEKHSTNTKDCTSDYSTKVI